MPLEALRCKTLVVTCSPEKRKEKVAPTAVLAVLLVERRLSLPKLKFGCQKFNKNWREQKRTRKALRVERLERGRVSSDSLRM